jgi:hypothetical protein
MNNFFSLNKGIIIFFVSCFSLLISFFLNEDGSGDGARGDFEVTYGFILALQENLLADPKDWTLVHTPLHFIILSFITRIITDTSILRFLFCFFALSIPILLYLSSSILKLDQVKKTNLLVLSSIVIMIPSFRYTSIWANDLITSLFFFILSIYFYKKWENKKTNFLDKNLLFQILFLVLATYTRQYFAVFFIYFLTIYFLHLSIQSFIKLFILCVISSIPVFYYVYLFPELLTGQHISLKAINFFILGNSSIISLTLFPIILLNLIFKKITLKSLIKPFIIALLIVIVLSLNFNPIDWKGGGVNYLISKKIFQNNLFFYFTSLVTITFFIYMALENKENALLLLIILFMFFSLQVYQRYYEPMFFIIFFTLIKTNLSRIFLENFKTTFILFFYFVLYYFVSISDLIYTINFN